MRPIRGVPSATPACPGYRLVQRWVGARGQAIVIRFMGLVLVAVGAQLVLGGIGDFFGFVPGGRVDTRGAAS